MDKFKITLFENEFGRSFPSYKELPKEECQFLLKSVCKTYRIIETNFATQLDSVQSFYSDSNAVDEDFKLKNTLFNLGISFNSTLFVNWFRFERIDAFYIDDLDEYFNNIWFHVADDIDLFDESLTWIVSIHHEGYISVVYASEDFLLAQATGR